MILQVERWKERVMGHPPTKPGRGEPEPLRPARTCDTPENVEACLSCPLPSCRPELPACAVRGIRPGKSAGQTKHEKVLERDNQIKALIAAGWRNDEAICEEFGIRKTTLYWSKRRLRERGEIP